MAWGWDNIVVVAIVLIAVAWAARGIWKAVRGRRVCSSCASQGDCPATKAQDLQNLQDISDSH